MCVCLCLDKSNYRALRGRESESGSGQITQDNSPGRQLQTLFTSLTKQMCWTDAAVMRCVRMCAERERKKETEDRMKDAKWGMRKTDDRREIKTNKRERERRKWQTNKQTHGKTSARDKDWQAERQTDREVESDRVQICFLFQIKGQPVQRLGQALSDLQIKLCSFGRERDTVKPNHPSTIPDQT